MIEEREDAGTGTVQVRPLRGSDIEQVSRIERRSFTSPWNTQAYVTEIANPSACYLAALIGDKLVGYTGMWVIMEEAHITTLAVDPDHRGQRIGERLLSDLLLRAQKRGATRATLEVRAGNEAAQRLYAKYGFQAVHVRRAYYSDNNEDALVMWIDDMAGAAWRKRFADLRATLGLPPA